MKNLNETLKESSLNRTGNDKISNIIVISESNYFKKQFTSDILQREA